MKSLSKLTLSVCLSALFTGPLATVTGAEVIQIPVASQGGEMKDIERPQNGLHRDQVLAQFGEPIEWNDAVGDPPISRWDYEHYYVFFEYDLVLHTVMKHRPQGDAKTVAPAK